jgi:hypothetical protein
LHGKELRLALTYDAFYKNMTNKKYHTVGTVQKSKRNIVERRTQLISRTHIYITAHFSGCTVSCRIKLSLWSQTFLLKLFLSTVSEGNWSIHHHFETTIFIQPIPISFVMWSWFKLVISGFWSSYLNSTIKTNQHRLLLKIKYTWSINTNKRRKTT